MWDEMWQWIAQLSQAFFSGCQCTDSNNMRLHVLLVPQFFLFFTCPRRYSPAFRRPWICQQPEVDRRQRRGIEARMWAWLPFTYLSSHYQFFIILTVLGICTGLWWEAEEGQAESRDSHTGSMITTTNNWQICSVHKVFGFLEKMVLGGTTELYHPKNEDNSFAEKPSANLQNSMFA